MTGVFNSDTRKASGMLGKEVGQPGFITASSWVMDQQEKALSPPARWKTYRDMTNDSCVSEALSSTQTFIFLALFKGRWGASEANTPLSRKLADFLNYNFLNMRSTTWADACQGFVTHVQDGLSLSEIITETAQTGPYRGSEVLAKLGHRLPHSIYGWVWDSKQREVKQVVQQPLKVLTQLKNSSRQAKSYLESIPHLNQFQDPTSNFYKYPVIDIRKMVHMRYRPEGANPLGRSPMNPAWAAWAQKVVIDQYQLIGITRDFGGIPVYKAPADLFEKASDPSKHPEEAQIVEQMQYNLSNLHAGREAWLMLPSDVQEGTQTAQFDIKFLGVEGGGKQFDTSAIIAAKNAEIYSAFSAGYLNLGKDGKTGSNALATSGFNIHTFGIEKEIIHCVAELEKLGKLLLEANTGEPVEYRDMPRFLPADPALLDVDMFGKLIQRLESVKKLTPEVLKYFTKKTGAPVEGIEDLDFENKVESGAGKGMGTSGNGVKTQENSVTNLDNKNLNLIQDPYGDGCVALIHADGPDAGKLFKVIEDDK